ncbi:hypothetical protein OIU34_17060 [Pararhizobium sp. BT-229]|uniref:hypothetical protein n=1 Tax=Pararhizobium sp. BT-229 TaxID=2986923 RepID=UPI0021F71BEB|nr:hypothetical protein [Pararhizobium sp. BT-229]MCV9963611.1 hypothetical protein [Pararhizobium sp. BT-229]
MKITLPWLRQARTKTRSNGYYHESFFRFEREFEFREFSAYEAPVAFSWPDVDIRSMEGRLWRRVFARSERHSRRFSASVVQDTVLSRDVIVGALLRNEGFRFMTDTYVNIDRSRIDPKPASGYKYFEWTDDELEKIGIEAWHSDVVLIDGEFWIACPCPTYAVDDDRVLPVTVAFPKLRQQEFYERSVDKLGDVSRSRRPFDERADDGALSLHFGVDEFEHAVAIARAGAVAERGRIVEDAEALSAPRRVFASKIETLLPQCVVPTALAPCAMMEAHSMFVSAVSHDDDGRYRGIRQFDAPALKGMAALQEVTFGRDLEDVDPDDLADAMEACLAGFSTSTVPVPEAIRIVVTTSIARTRNRAFDMPFS